MGTAKERKYKKTNQALWDAFERLKLGQPVTDELKRRRKIKVNNYTVEIEAGLSVGVLKNHPDIKKAISQYQEGITTTTFGYSESGDIATHKLNEMKGRLKKEVKQKNQYADEVGRLTESMKNQLASHHELVVALFSKIPLEEREPLLRKYDNVVPLRSKT